MDLVKESVLLCDPGTGSVLYSNLAARQVHSQSTRVAKTDIYYTIRPFKRTPGTKIDCKSLEVWQFWDKVPGPAVRPRDRLRPLLQPRRAPGDFYPLAGNNMGQIKQNTLNLHL